MFLTRLHYTQLRVNAVSIAAEVSMYLPVPLFGYLCDRYSPSPLALFSGVVFGTGYFLAAFAYRSGPPPDAGGEGWPFWVMIVAFVAIGTATSSMYLAAVTTCAKNFGRGKHKGIMLAVPIAGFGLSGMWQSQVGTYLLCERLEDGSRGDVDVFRYFLFLGALLLAIGIIGTFGLRIVDDEEERYIDATVDELERSGLLDESEFFRSGRDEGDRYGTFSRADGSSTEGDMSASEEEREAARLYKVREEEERQKKTWLLNYETRTFLADHTMWWLALGFFLVTGPGEAYINNVRTSSHRHLFSYHRHEIMIETDSEPAGYHCPNAHAGECSGEQVPCRTARDARHHHRTHIDRRSTADRLAFGLLRSTRIPSLTQPSGRRRFRAVHSSPPLPPLLPSSVRLSPPSRLPPPRDAAAGPAPRALAPHDRPSRPRLW